MTGIGVSFDDCGRKVIEANRTQKNSKIFLNNFLFANCLQMKKAAISFKS